MEQQEQAQTQEMSPEAKAETNETQSENKKTPWYGFPSCEELGKPSLLDKGLKKAGEWLFDKLPSPGILKPIKKFLSNKVAPWNFRDGPMGRCPIDKE
jgi:hypothetical protein